ncbi:MAG: response regulator transcription factor [Desulfobacterales bacterium]|nr:response regulator transcription factor [Desulfobacterales bacterium]
MEPLKILIAEDDDNIRMGLVDTLESEGYGVVEAENGARALELYGVETPDLLILDVMMPELSGYDLCRKIRAQSQDIPIIMLTAKGEEIDKVVGLELGADDYITKPFGIHELLARIKAVLRRSQRSRPEPATGSEPAFTFGPFTINPKTFRLSGDGMDQDISKRELALIRLFANHPDEVLDREFILGHVWGMDYPGTTRTLDQHIAQLRKKINPSKADQALIATVHGIGYRYQP